MNTNWRPGQVGEPRRFANLRTARRRGDISWKLLLLSLLAVTLLIANAAITVIFVQRMEDSVRRLAEVEEPLEQAALEMEINALERARGVLNFINLQNAESLLLIEDSRVDFDRYSNDFARLAKTEEELRLAGDVNVLHDSLNVLAEELVDLARAKSSQDERFDELISVIDAQADQTI